MSKPNTLEAWYADAIRFLHHRYRYEPETFREELEGRFAIRAARRWEKFDPTRGKAFTYLCWMVRGVYSDACRKRSHATDVYERYASALVYLHHERRYE